jgi:hypothetical protein
MLVDLTKLERDVLVKACAELLAGEWDATEEQAAALASAQRKLSKQTRKLVYDNIYKDDPA